MKNYSLHLQLCSIIIFYLLCSTQSVNAVNTPLEKSLTELVETHPLLKGAITGISIRSAKSGEIIYNYNGDLRLTPASNLKIFTTAAALSTLGKDYRFQTELRTNGHIQSSKLKGDLFLIGKGDPTLLEEDFQKFAMELKKKGINRISGDLIGDDTHYDQEYYSIDIPWSDESAYYGSAISALSISPNKEYDTGTVIIEVSPHPKQNKRATISKYPNVDYIKVINHTKTVDTDGKRGLSIIREHGTNTITISGTIPISSTSIKKTIAVWEPTYYALNVFKGALEKQGITLEGATKVGKASSDTELLHVHESIPLNELLIPFMKLSKNAHAEVLVKEMGRVFHQVGSWEEGIKVEKFALTTLGLNAEELEIRDGSGISHLNLVKANDITELLFHVQQMNWFPEFYRSFPLAGVSDKMVGGTLKNRFKSSPFKGNIVAKTGTLTNVSSLSGYIDTEQGKMIFSIIFNHLRNSDHGKQMEEEILQLIINH